MEHLNCCTGTRIGKYSLQFSIKFLSILQWSSQSPGLLAECGLILFWPPQQLEVWTLERQQEITKCRPGIRIWMPVCISSRNIYKLVMFRSSQRTLRTSVRQSLPGPSSCMIACLYMHIDTSDIDVTPFKNSGYGPDYKCTSMLQ